MSSPRATWARIGQKYFRKIELYSDVFDEDLELENYTVVGAPYGGALGIALLPCSRANSARHH
jgi:hypothetical protein